MRSRQLGDLGSFSVDDLLAELKSCGNDAVEMTKMGGILQKEEAKSHSE